MYLALDGRPLIRQPHQIEIVPYEHDAGLTADGRPRVRPGAEGYVQLNCTWGREVTYQDVLGELHRKRANRGVHSISFQPRHGCRPITVNAWMGQPRVTHVGYTAGGKLAQNAVTIPFVQVDTPTGLYALRLAARGIIAVAAPIASHVAPAAGQIVAVDGWIRDLGSGTGQTSIQVSNGATNYLSTEGDFVQGGNHQLQNQALATDLDFDGGDQIDLDVTDIPTGGLSGDALVTVWAWLFRP